LLGSQPDRVELIDRAQDGSLIDITIEKIGDHVVKRRQVRPMTSPASSMVLPIAAE
jgi:hypothetical protein